MSERVESENGQVSPHGGEYISRRSGRHGSTAVHRSSRSGLRARFFAAAAVWGFLVGIAGLFATLRISATPLRVSSVLVLGLCGSLVVAVAGARVLASAYDEFKRR